VQTAKTYNDLLNVLLIIPEERRKDHISIQILDDFVEVKDIYISTESFNDVLDEGHLVLHVAE